MLVDSICNMGTTCINVANATNILLLNLTFNPSTLPYRYTGAFRSKISKLAAYSFDSQKEILYNLGTHDLSDRYALSPWVCSSWLWTDK